MLFPCLSWLSLFAIYLHSAPGAFYFEDSPELLACAVSLGNTHEPGYPLFTMAGRLALLVPAGAPSLRLNLMGAAFGALAAVALGLLVFRAASRLGGRGLAAWAGVFAGGVWGLSDAFWWQASIGEKYPPFYLVFVLLVALAWAAGVENPGRRWTAVAGLAAGMAFAHHQYAVFALPALGFAVWHGRAGRGLAMALALFLIPVSTKVLYPPMRSAAGAQMDWGSPRSAGNLGSYLTARRYRAEVGATSLVREPGKLGRRLVLLGKFALEEVPLPLMVAGPVGAVALCRLAPAFAWVLAGCAALNAGYVLNATEEVVRWYEPLFALLVMLAALGWAVVGGRVRRGGLALVAGIAVLGAGWQGLRNAGRNDLSSFALAHDFGRNILRSIPSGAVHLGGSDADLFPLWALRVVDGERTDVLAVGAGSHSDPRAGDAAAWREARRELGVEGSGRGILREILRGRHGRPVTMAVTGLPPDFRSLAGDPPFVMRGLVARAVPRWDCLESARETRDTARSWSLRGLAYGRAGTVGVVEGRPRDEVAGKALMHYFQAFETLGLQLLSCGQSREADRAFRRSLALAAPLVGWGEVPGMREAYPGTLTAVRQAFTDFADAYGLLARKLRSRGVEKLAEGCAARAGWYRGLLEGM